ncbi:MAG: Hercynine oxygenase [Candidatus Erwinia impunctatus]
MATLSQVDNALPAVTRTLRLSTGSSEEKRQELLDYFSQTWSLYESLFDCLADEQAYYTKANPLRHPLIFYFGHTASFYINKLMAAGILKQRVNDDIEAMMAIGVDEMSWDDLNRGHYSWPALSTLREYRHQVFQVVRNVILEMPLTLPVTWESPAWVILMGIEHERIHLETSSVLIRELPLAWVHSRPEWPVCPQARHQRSQVPENSLLVVHGGEVRQGKNDDTYGWDNEYGSKITDIDTFQASKMLVSNAEFFQFVADGGYQHDGWWDDEGLGWRNYRQATAPVFWVGSPATPERLKLRLMTEVVDMPWDWPVEVNQLEAAAFCRWKAEKTGLSVQLPSEGEWLLLREQLASDQPDWITPPGNINLAWWASCCPVDLFATGDFFDLVGNVWQWTSTPISGLEGFKVHPLYDDFSTPTFDGKHTLIKGGSWISTGNEALKSSRYAFRRHFFQHAGFRYVASSHEEKRGQNPYESDGMVSQYLDFHYGPDYLDVANYSKVLVDIACEFSENRHRAMDIGCATGRASFELARHFSEVTGMDYSARFIDVALQIATGEDFRYLTQQEGELVEYHQINLHDIDLSQEQAARVQFVQGDACNLKPQSEQYDLLLAANLIDRLRQSERFLDNVSGLLKPGGILMLSSPYTWLDTFTPRENWLGGKRENGAALTTYQAMQRQLQKDFIEIAPPKDIPFVIKETARKYQYTIAQLTIWRRR